MLRADRSRQLFGAAARIMLPTICFGTLSS